ncbi:MAG TPA: hypothetical protein VK480_11115 [Solirubrobacterales bacterium]|nr:hypothetical protein [Solirubrobacterales bacterium]
MLPVNAPEWEPLLNFAPDHIGDFMWMYAVELTDRTRLQAYKHCWTRDYLHLDDEGRAFIFVGKERYEEVNPPWLLSQVLNEELGPRLSRYTVRQNVWPDEPIISFTRSATKHRISRERSLYVIEGSGIQFVDEHRSRIGSEGEQHLLFVGDDLEGVAIEVLVAEIEEEEFIAIHAMNLRARFRALYEEAIKWRK